jgi:hypothetical protein
MLRRGRRRISGKPHHIPNGADGQGNPRCSVPHTARSGGAPDFLRRIFCISQFLTANHFGPAGKDLAGCGRPRQRRGPDRRSPSTCGGRGGRRTSGRCRRTRGRIADRLRLRGRLRCGADRPGLWFDGGLCGGFRGRRRRIEPGLLGFAVPLHHFWRHAAGNPGDAFGKNRLPVTRNFLLRVPDLERVERVARGEERHRQHHHEGRHAGQPAGSGSQQG